MSTYEQDWWTIEAMIREGGSFVSALGRAARVADPVNLAIIKQSWPTYWTGYEAAGERLKNQEVESGN